MSEPGAMVGSSSGNALGGGGSGRWIVGCLVLLGLAAAVTGIAFQRLQTRRCLEFYGPHVARRITAAPRVEVWLVRPSAGEGGVVASERVDVSRAPGLVHLRRGLVEDANFRWDPGGGVANGAERARLPDEAWDVAIVFSDSAADVSTGFPRGRMATGTTDTEQGTPTALLIDFDPAGGALAVVGQPGRIGLGRIAAGLESWIKDTLDGVRAARSTGKTGLFRTQGRPL